MQIDFTQRDISGLLSSIGIVHEINSSNNIKIICPYHEDKSFGNCVIRKNTGNFKCYKCQEYGDIIKLTQTQLGLTFNEALDFIGIEKDNFEFSKNEYNSKRTLIDYKTPSSIDNKSISKSESKSPDSLLLTDFNPSDFKYTTDRGITESFIKEFNVKYCYKGFFYGFMIIPIYDAEKNVNSYEARKLIEYELLSDMFSNKDFSLSDLRILYKEKARVEQIRIEKVRGKAHIVKGQDIVSGDEAEKYQFMILPKTYYPPKSLVEKPTIWNRPNLNTKEVLYLVEGWGSICKIYENISKNVSCTFGATITDVQIDILSEFDLIYIISDNDDAALLMIKQLYLKCRAEVYIIDMDSDDEDNSFVEDIKSKPKLSYLEYFMKMERRLKSKNHTN